MSFHRLCPRSLHAHTLVASVLATACATQQPPSASRDAGRDAASDLPAHDTGVMVAPGNIVPPRPSAPLSTAIVNTRQPLFRWVLPQGVDGAQVDVCADRMCNQVSETFTASGSSGQPTNAIPPGLFFWRLRGTVNGTVGTTYSPVWQGQTLARNARAGGSWGTILDINGDGVPDIAAGAPGTSPTAGRVAVFLGTNSGYISAPTFSLAPPASAPTHFGASVVSGGDLDGDGYADLVVGAPSDSTGDTSLGAVYVYPGSLTGIPTGPAVTIPAPALRSLFGASVAGIGDLNGDGYADLAVGAPDVQIVYIFYGGAMVPAPPPVETDAGFVDDLGDGSTEDATADAGTPDVPPAMVPGVATVPSAMIANNTTGSTFGTSLAAAGDVNNDGYADILVGDPGVLNGRGSAFIFLGSPHGPLSSPIVIASPDPTDVAFGAAVAGVGDVNGDGVADFAVGAPGSPGGGGGDAGPVGTGRVYVYYGNTTAPGSFVGARLVAAGSANLGASVSGGGDINGDGNADILAGGPGATESFFPADAGVDGGTDSGTDAGHDAGRDGGTDASADVGDGASEPAASGAYLFLGGVGAVNPNVAAALTTTTVGTRSGWAVAVPGDYNGDDLFDLAVSEPLANGGVGAVHIFLGSMTAVSPTSSVDITGSTANSALGTSLAH